LRCQSNVAECQDELGPLCSSLSFMTREETKRRLDELAREYVATHDPGIVEELYRLARELEKMDMDKE
jgi:hypothetical protein